MNFFKSYSLFLKVFFVFFTTTTIILFFIPLITQDSNLYGLLSFFSIIGLISSLTGVLTSIYQVRGNLIFYLWWMINTATYALIVLHEDLYGQFMLNAFIVLPLEVFGFIQWKKNISTTKKKSIEIKVFKPYMWVICFITFIISWFLYHRLLISLSQILKSLFNMNIPIDGQPLLDSFTSVAIIFAVYFTSKRYLEQWYFWLLSNLDIILFIKSIILTKVFSSTDLAGILVIAQYSIICIYAMVSWIKLLKKSNLKAIST